MVMSGSRTDNLLITTACVALFVVLLLFFSPWAERLELIDQEPLGKVEEILGSVRRRHTNSLVWSDLQASSFVYYGDSLFSDKNAEVKIRLQDGTLLRVLEGTLAVLRAQDPTDKQTETDAIGVFLARGGAYVATEGALTIVSKNFAADLIAGAVARAYVGAGSEEFALMKGRGEFSDGESRQELVASQRLLRRQGTWKPLAAETIQSVAPEEEARIDSDAAGAGGVQFHWNGLGERQQLEVAETPTFDTVLLRRESKDGKALQLPLDPGVYYWRVRGSLPGLVTESSVRRLHIVAREQP